MGSTRWPSALAGTPGPMLWMMPTPSKPGLRGNVVRDAYAPGDRHRVGGVEGTNQHAHHHFPGTKFPRFGNITDHNGVDGAGRFSDGSKHASSLVEVKARG